MTIALKIHIFIYFFKYADELIHIWCLTYITIIWGSRYPRHLELSLGKMSRKLVPPSVSAGDYRSKQQSVSGVC